MADPNPVRRNFQGHMTSIGAVAVNWSFLEHYMDTAIWQLLGVSSDRGRAVTTHLNAPGRLHLYRTLIDTLVENTQARQEALKIADRFDELSKRRNKVVHGFWVPGAFVNENDADYVRVRFTARGKLQSEITPMTERQISAISRWIIRLSARLAKFFDTCPHVPRNIDYRGFHVGHER